MSPTRFTTKIGLSLISEIWEVKGKKKHMCEITKMLEKDGLKYISTPRASQKRGGGCAIVAYLPQFSLSKIDVIIIIPWYEFHRLKNLGSIVFGM